jgi:hypothetical protein
MTAPRDPDRLIHGFLLEGEEYLQDRVYDEVRAAIEHKRQQAFIGPWRTPIMNKFVGYGLAAVAVVAVLLIGYRVIGSPANTGSGGEPTPTAEASVTEPSPPAGAALDEGPFVLSDEGPITVTIPAPGWYSDGGTPMKNGNSQPPDGAYVLGPWTSVQGLYIPGDPCQWESTMPDTTATTVDDIVAALESQASRNASAPVDITLDGHAGKSITLHVPDDAAHTSGGFTDCDQGQFCTFGSGPTNCQMWNAQGPGAIDELWIVDVDGEIFLLTGAYYAQTPAEHVDEVRAILGSMTFGA